MLRTCREKKMCIQYRIQRVETKSIFSRLFGWFRLVVGFKLCCVRVWVIWLGLDIFYLLSVLGVGYLLSIFSLLFSECSAVRCEASEWIECEQLNILHIIWTESERYRKATGMKQIRIAFIYYIDKKKALQLNDISERLPKYRWRWFWMQVKLFVALFIAHRIICEKWTWWMYLASNYMRNKRENNRKKILIIVFTRPVMFFY